MKAKKKRAIKVWPGWTEQNAQHLAWLKRKLIRAARYERATARRRPPGGGDSLPRHKQSRAPTPSIYEMRPWRIARDAVTGKPIGVMIR